MGSLAPIHWILLLMCGGALFVVFALGRLLWNKGGPTERIELRREKPTEDTKREGD